jgi:hypothetical protein
MLAQGALDERREGPEEEPVDWCQLSVDAMNRHTTSPEFTAKYKAWLEKIGPELWGPVGKADYEKIIAEEAAAKQAKAKS